MALAARRAGIAVAGALAVGGAALVVTDDGGERAGARSAATLPVAAAAITRRDLVDIAVEGGTLGYADPRGATSALPGTVTQLPTAGRVVGPDDVLLRIDESPVILMNGRVPAYRALGPGVPAGRDVLQLERSLRATGYDRDRQLALDEVWDAATTAAVERWQQAHGLSVTGAIEPGRIVFLPGRRRVAGLGIALGARSGSPGMVATTSTRRRVTVQLDTTRSNLAKPGARVTVELPSERRVAGRVTFVGKVAVPARAQEEAAGSTSVSATIEVRIRLLEASAGLDQAPVTVTFEKARRQDVLAVPVTALLARPGGRFAVQLINSDRSTRVVEVDPGLYANGYVEIAATGLSEGLRVTNAAVR